MNMSIRAKHNWNTSQLLAYKGLHVKKQNRNLIEKNDPAMIDSHVTRYVLHSSEDKQEAVFLPLTSWRNISSAPGSAQVKGFNRKAGKHPSYLK